MSISRSMLVITGVVSLLAGLLAIFYPGPSLLVLAVITGFNLVVIGVLGLVDLAIGDRDEKGLEGGVLVYATALIAGVLVMRRPGDSVLALVLVFGVWFVVAGIVGLIGVAGGGGDRGARALGAVAEATLGIVILSLPDVSVKTLAVLAGISFVVHGIVLIVRGWRVGRQEPAVQATPRQASL